MGTQALLAVLCWLMFSESSGEAANPENSLLVKDNVSAESAPRLYRSVPVGVYASASPYAAFSYRIPTFLSGPITSASRPIPVKEHAVLNNVNAYLRDSYGNRFVGTPQTAAYKSTIPQQYVQLQALPAHFAEPLAAAAPNHQAKQERSQTAFGSHYRLPFVQASAASNNFAGASQPYVYAQNIRSWAPSSTGHAQFQRLVAPQQQAPSDRGLYTQSYRNYHNFNSEPKFQRLEEKPAPLKQIVIENNISQFKEGPSQGDHANLKASPDTQTYTTIVNGKKTIIELETKPSLPLLDLTLLEPLTFDNPVVPQVQHFLPRINQATYKKLPEFNDHQKKSGNQNKKPKPKKKQKRPVENDDELPQQAPVEPTVTVKGTPNGGPEIFYEIDTPNHKETYKEKTISYNKETNKEPVTYSYDHKDEKKPVSYSYGNIVQKEPVHYSYVSDGPTQNKEAYQNNPVTHLIYTLKPEEQYEDDDDEGSIHLESEDTGSVEESDDETHQPHRAEHLEHHQESPEHRSSDRQQQQEYHEHHADSPDHKTHQPQRQEYHEQPKHKLHHPHHVEYQVRHAEPRHNEESQSLKHEQHQPEYVEHHEKSNRQEHHSHHEKHQGHHKEPLSHKSHQVQQQAHHEHSSEHQPHQPQLIEHKERHDEPLRHNPHRQQHAEHYEHREPSRHTSHQPQRDEHHEHREPSRHNPHQQQRGEHHEHREPSRHNPHQQQRGEHHEYREPSRHTSHQPQRDEHHEHREPSRHTSHQPQRDEHHEHREPSRHTSHQQQHAEHHEHREPTKHNQHQQQHAELHEQREPPSHNAHKPKFIEYQEHDKSPRHQEHPRQEHHQLEYKQNPNGDEYHNAPHAAHKPSPQQYSHSAVEHAPELQAITQEYEEDIRLIPTQGPNAAIQVDPNQHIQKLTSDENPHPSPVPHHHQQHYEEQQPNHVNPHHQQHFEEQQPNHVNPHHQQHYEEQQPNHVNPHHQQHYEEQQPNHPSPHVPSGPVPIIHETSKRIIIQEETPDEMHSHQEQMLAKMLEEQENNEEDFEKAYKNAAFGFPGYNKDSEAIEKDIYNPNSYGVSQEQGYEIDHAPFQEYQAEGDEFPKAARLRYKDARDDIKNDYFLEYAVHKPESIQDRYKKKKEYYKLYENYKPEKFFGDEKKEKQKDKYTLAPSFSYNSEPAKEENKNKLYFAQYKAATPKYKYSYSKPKAHDNSAFDSRPYQSYTSKTHFVEPQFQYGFEPIAIPRLLDSELAAMASNDSPESDKPGMRKKVYKENWYIKKTSTAGGDAAS